MQSKALTPTPLAKDLRALAAAAFPGKEGHAPEQIAGYTKRSHPTSASIAGHNKEKIMFNLLSTIARVVRSHRTCRNLFYGMRFSAAYALLALTHVLIATTGPVSAKVSKPPVTTVGESPSGGGIGGTSSTSAPFAMLITGVSPYAQQHYTKSNGNTVWEGCGPVAALMLLSYYDKRFGYANLIPSAYESSTSTPDALIQKLRDKMLTTVVGADDWGLTYPLAFKSGLKSYIKDCGYTADIDSKGSSDVGVSVDAVFNKSVALIQQNTVHVLLLDWSGSQPWPSHYVVVVGYDTGSGNKRLIVSNGFGDDFQAVDFNDTSLKPVRAIWMTLSTSPDGSKDGHQIGPAAWYPDRYVTSSSSGGSGFQPTILEPPTTSGGSSLHTWRLSDECTIDVKYCLTAKWF